MPASQSRDADQARSAPTPRSLARRALALTRMAKKRVALLGDSFLCVSTVYLSMYLRLGAPPRLDEPYLILTLCSLLFALPSLWISGVYNEIFSLIGLRSLRNIGRGSLIYALPMALIFTLVSINGVPRTMGLLHPLLLFLAIASSRVFAQAWLSGGSAVGPAAARNVVIYGAGADGRRLAASVRQNPAMRLVGFLDDDATLQGAQINGLPIFDPSQLAELKARRELTDVVLALGAAPRARRTEIIRNVRSAALRVLTLPGPMETDAGAQASDIRELDLEDLLDREPVAPDVALLQGHIEGRVVLVTGAGGSIGSELSRQILSAGPAKLLLFETHEYALYAIHSELRRRLGRMAGQTEIVPLLGSVTDQARMRAVMDTWRPDSVYHAAAYKHVPLVELNPLQGVWNNVYGTYVAAHEAVAAGVRDFVLISTDKAVRPTNVMGASKRCAELIVQAIDGDQDATRLSMVRFGNVLGSSGSVVPLFRQQIRNGGPVTVTDLRVTRYFMTIPEAAQLVLQAGAMARGGDVFVLDMGQPVRIADLARNMIELSGFRTGDPAQTPGAIDVVEVGLRPGEKLYEELLIGNDPEPTDHPRILRARDPSLSLDELQVELDALWRTHAAGDAHALIALVRRLVPEFETGGTVFDVVQQQRAQRLDYDLDAGGRFEPDAR